MNSPIVEFVKYGLRTPKAAWRELAGLPREMRARAGYQRRMRLYVVGLPKTGTTTLGTMFQKNYRSRHEYQDWLILPLINRYLTGDLDEAVMLEKIRERVESGCLDVDSASYIGHFAGYLAETYADAQFVITVRDCFTWLRSIISHIDATGGSVRLNRSPWTDYQDIRFKPAGLVYLPEEAGLKVRGLYPIRGFLSYWATMNRTLLDVVPEERRLILYTHEINNSLPRLAEFCGVAPESIQPAHANRMRKPSDVLDEIPRELILESARELCGPVMEQLYGPDWLPALEHQVGC